MGNPLLPRWRRLDLITLFVIGLLVIDGKAHLSRLGHQFAEVAILLVWVVLMYLWLQANASAISQEQWQKNGKTYRIVPGHITVYRNSALPGYRSSDFNESARGSSCYNQTSTAPENDSVHTLDPSPVPSVRDIATSVPDATETASTGSTGTVI